MLTLTATRSESIELLAIRAQIRDLQDRADALSASLRPALAHWTEQGQGVAVSDSRSVYVTDDATRKGWDLVSLASLALTIPAVAACQTETPVRGSVRDRNRKATDR